MTNTISEHEEITMRNLEKRKKSLDLKNKEKEMDEKLLKKDPVDIFNSKIISSKNWGNPIIGTKFLPNIKNSKKPNDKQFFFAIGNAMKKPREKLAFEKKKNRISDLKKHLHDVNNNNFIDEPNLDNKTNYVS